MLGWLTAFLLTLGFELPVAGALLRGREASRAVLLAKLVFANLSTHPLVWFAFPLLPVPWAATIALAELFAFLAEAAFFSLAIPKVTPARAALASLAANGTSFALGLLVYRLFPGLGG